MKTPVATIVDTIHFSALVECVGGIRKPPNWATIWGIAVETIVASMEIMNMEIITDAMTSDRADFGSLGNFIDS